MSTTAQQNGATAPGANLPAKKGEQSPAKQTTPSGESLKLSPIKENPPMTVEETIRKVNELQDNIDKREVLKNHYQAVSTLKFGEYDEKDKIMLITHDSQKYEIKSSALCQEVAELIKRRIKEHIDEVEQQIVL